MVTDKHAQKAVGVVLAYKKRQFAFYRTMSILTGVIFGAVLPLAMWSGHIENFLLPAVWFFLTAGMVWKAYENWRWIKDE